MKQEAHPRASFPALECRLAERSTRNKLKQSFEVPPFNLKSADALNQVKKRRRRNRQEQ